MATVLSPGVEPDFEEIRRITDRLPEEDGIPMDSPWHRTQMNVLIDIVSWHRRKRDNFYVGGNMFIYYELQGKKAKGVGPDFFFVDGVERRRYRRIWAVGWRNGSFRT